MINPRPHVALRRGAPQLETRSGATTASGSCPARSSLWLDALGRRLPAPLFPGFDTLGTLAHVMRTGYEHTWFVLTQRIIEKEFALSGSEQNPDLTGKSIRQVLGRARGGAPGPGRGVQAERRGLRRRGHAARARPRDERARREPLLDLAAARARDRRARPGGRQPVHEGRPDHGDPRRPPVPRRPPHPRRRSRTASSIPTPGRSSRCG